jgi:hypothetical protein
VLEAFEEWKRQQHDTTASFFNRNVNRMIMGFKNPDPDVTEFDSRVYWQYRGPHYMRPRYVLPRCVPDALVGSWRLARPHEDTAESWAGLTMAEMRERTREEHDALRSGGKRALVQLKTCRERKLNKDNTSGHVFWISPSGYIYHSYTSGFWEVTVQGRCFGDWLDAAPLSIGGNSPRSSAESGAVDSDANVRSSQPTHVDLVVSQRTGRLGIIWAKEEGAATIRSVRPGSWAEQHGLDAGDYVHAINGDVSMDATSTDVCELLKARPVGVTFGKAAGGGGGPTSPCYCEVERPPVPACCGCFGELRERRYVFESFEQAYGQSYVTINGRRMRKCGGWADGCNPVGTGGIVGFDD